MSDQETGFIAGPLLYSLGLFALVGTVAFTGYTQILSSTVEMQRSASTQQKGITAARALAASSVLCTGTGEVVNGVTCSGPGFTPVPPDTFPVDNSVPENEVVLGPGGGAIPLSSSAPKTDSHGRLFAYCVADSSTLSGTTTAIAANPAYAVISAGADGTLDTSCAQALSDSPQNDDKVEAVLVSDALDHAIAWNRLTDTEITFGASAPSGARVGIGTNTPTEQLDVNGNARIANNISVGGNANIAGDAAVTGAVTSDSVTTNTAQVGTVNATSVTAANIAATGQLSGNSLSLTNALPVSEGGTGADTALGARSNLGATTVGDDVFTAVDEAAARSALLLGTIATQDANSVSITGGSISGITDLAVEDGGTGASTALGARVNLGADNASNLTQGTMPVGRLPAFSGDAASTAGTASLTVQAVQGQAVSTTAPASGESLIWNGSAWEAATPTQAGNATTADSATTATNADNADKLDSLNSTQFLRSDAFNSSDARFLRAYLGNSAYDRGASTMDGALEFGGSDGALIQSIQDGSGRFHMLWNATQGTAPTYVTSGEPAGEWDFDPLNVGSLFAVRHAPAATAGDPISWTNVLALDTTSFRWMGNDIWHTGNFDPSNYLPTAGGSVNGQVDFVDGQLKMTVGVPSANSLDSSVTGPSVQIDGGNLHLLRNGSESSHHDLAVRLYNISETYSTTISGRRARGTLASPAFVNNGDLLLAINGSAIDPSGTFFQGFGGGSISFVAEENHSATGAGSGIRFSVTPKGSTAKSVLFKLTSDMTGVLSGSLGVSTTPVAPFDNGKSIAIGDGNSGIRQNGNGVIEVVSDDTVTATFEGNRITTHSLHVSSPGSGNNTNIWITDDAEVPQGVLYWNRADDTLRLRRYAPDGSNLEGEITMGPDGAVKSNGGMQASQIAIGFDPYGTLPYTYESIQLPSGRNFRFYAGTNEILTLLGTSKTVVAQGSVGIGTLPSGTFDNRTALALGDADTGIRQNGDGILEVWTNNQHRITVGINRTRLEAGYFEIEPYDPTYDDGSRLQMYYDGNNRQFRMQGRDSAYAQVPVDFRWVGAITSTDDINVGRDLYVNSRVYIDGTDIELFNVDRCKSDTAGGTDPLGYCDRGRALVHNNGDRLNINFADDYDGGVQIGSDAAPVHVTQGFLGVNKMNPTYPLDVNGTASVTTVVYTSDARRKNVSGDLTGPEALDLLREMPAVRFTYKDDTSKTKRVGFVAQDVQKVIPEVVSEGKDGYLFVDYPSLAAPLASAVVELDKRTSGWEKQNAWLSPTLIKGLLLAVAGLALSQILTLGLLVRQGRRKRG